MSGQRATELQCNYYAGAMVAAGFEFAEEDAALFARMSADAAGVYLCCLEQGIGDPRYKNTWVTSHFALHRKGLCPRANEIKNRRR